MANRRWERNQLSIEKSLVLLFADFSVGASGAPTLNNSSAISAVTRDGAGAYTLTFRDKYYAFRFMEFCLQEADADDYTFQVTSVDLQSATLSFVCLQAGVATDLPNGSKLWMKVIAKNTDLNP